MELFTDIQTPTAIYHGVKWPQGVPHPAAGDLMSWRENNQSWLFQVTGRHIQAGIDPRTGGPQARVLLKVDCEAPEGFRM